MAIVCDGCGGYIQPEVDAGAQSMRCGLCGQQSALRILPLFVVTGASAVGKSAVVGFLRPLLPEWDIFDSDVLHGESWQQVKCNWLRVAHSISQCGRYTMLCGTILPADLAACDHRPFFSQVYFLNLHCADEVRAARLRARPAWRGCDEAFIEQHRHFARWLLDHAAEFCPPMPTLETTQTPAETVAGQIRDWALAQLALSPAHNR